MNVAKIPPRAIVEPVGTRTYHGSATKNTASPT